MAWDIPITADVTSVGCVMTASKVREQRRRGHDIRDILACELRKHSRFAQLVADQPDFPVRTMAYRSYVHAKVCGPNWLMVGESASLPDPATANGVTAALRHALSAATYILQAKAGQLSARQRRVYDTNVRRMGHVFNHSIETAVYGGTIRRGFGGFVAQRVYTAFSYVVNALYSRMRPESSARMAAFGLLVKFVWVWMVLWSLAGRSATFARRLAAAPRSVAHG